LPHGNYRRCYRGESDLWRLNAYTRWKQVSREWETSHPRLTRAVAGGDQHITNLTARFGTDEVAEAGLWTSFAVARELPGAEETGIGGGVSPSITNPGSDPPCQPGPVVTATAVSITGSDGRNGMSLQAVSWSRERFSARNRLTRERSRQTALGSRALAEGTGVK